MITDFIYQNLLREIHDHGVELMTRNARVRSCIHLNPVIFTQTPLVTLRKTAWKMAIREMEWFMSGDTKCPDELMGWWKDQLGHGGTYRGGYSNQYRYSGFTGTQINNFDQIKYLLDGLRSNPNSRRLVMTSWNPLDMAHITFLNENPNTPTTCHSSFVQFFVREGKLHVSSLQRSADMILGFPHNLIQTWALLLYFAHHASLEVGSLRWILNDAHIYWEESHVDTTYQLLSCRVDKSVDNTFNLCYNPVVKNEGVPVFRAADFTMDGVIPYPKVLTKPVLL